MIEIVQFLAYSTKRRYFSEI